MDRGGDGSDLELQKKEWARTQDVLKSRLVLEDDFEWSLPSVSSKSDQCEARGKLKYIGGVDISFLKEDPSTACAAVVVLDADTLEIVHEEFDVVRMQVPYIPGFLAFREFMYQPVSYVRKPSTHAGTHSSWTPGEVEDQCSSFLPSGLLRIYSEVSHGVACLISCCCACDDENKNYSWLMEMGYSIHELHHVDGLDQSEVRKQLEAKGNCNKECISLTGQSGTAWGAAMCSCPGSSRPIYISVGHRISLDSAIGIVKYCCRYRVPEPTRQADIRSKVFLQKHQRLHQ